MGPCSTWDNFDETATWAQGTHLWLYQRHRMRPQLMGELPSEWAHDDTHWSLPMALAWAHTLLEISLTMYPYGPVELSCGHYRWH